MYRGSVAGLEWWQDTIHRSEWYVQTPEDGTDLYGACTLRMNLAHASRHAIDAYSIEQAFDLLSLMPIPTPTPTPAELCAIYTLVESHTPPEPAP